MKAVLLPALALGAIATSAHAEPMDLTDAQMDQVTAGGLGAALAQIPAATEMAASLVADALSRAEPPADLTSNNTVASIIVIQQLWRFASSNPQHAIVLRGAVGHELHYQRHQSVSSKGESLRGE